MNEPEPLLDRTYRLLANRRDLDLTLKDIAEGADVDESWLAKFNRKVIPSPGVNLVQKVHDFLASRAA